MNHTAHTMWKTVQFDIELRNEEFRVSQITAMINVYLI